MALAGGLLMLTGCNKKLSKFESDYFTTTPTPMETVGQNVPATVTGHIPAKFMVKNAKVTTTPVLKWSSGEAKGERTVIQGEDVRDNGQVVSYKNGGTVQIPFIVAYEPGMAQSDLWLEFEVDQNGKIYALPQVKVGRGVIATSTLASAATVNPAIAKDSFQKVVNEKFTANINFLVNQANIRNSETSSDAYKALNAQLKEAAAAPDREIAGLTINSYASPEGTYEFNEQLAQKREASTTTLLENQLKKDKISDFGELTSSFTPEDWEGFQQLLEKSNIQDKELILAILQMHKDPAEREKEIRNLSSVFNEIKEQIRPQLRYSRIVASINVLGKSDQELVELFNKDPQKLTVDEMLYVATLTNDNAKKMDVYEKVCQQFPTDFRGFNDLGATQFAMRDYSGAKQSFEKALRLNPQSKEAEMNLGLLAMLNNDMNRAGTLLGGAAALPEAGDALGVYYLSQGDLNKALSSFGSAKTNNAALAQILAKDYQSARNTLAAISNPDATTYYLAAVLGARTGSENMVMTNLRQAIRLDSSILSKARKDLEFANYNLNSL